MKLVLIVMLGDLVLGMTSRCLFDARVFHLSRPSYHNSTIPSIYCYHEQEKKREYSDHVQEVGKTSFTPLAFVTTGI